MKMGLRLLVGGIFCAVPLVSFADCPATIMVTGSAGSYSFVPPSGWKQYTNGITAKGTGTLQMVSLSSQDVRSTSSMPLLANVQIMPIVQKVPSCMYGVNVDKKGKAWGGFFSITPTNPSFRTNLIGPWEYQNPVQSYVCTTPDACQFYMP